MNFFNSKPSNVLLGLYLVMMVAFLAGIFLSEWEDTTSLRDSLSSLQLKDAIVKKEGDNHLVNDSLDAPLPLAWIMSFPNSGTCKYS